MEDLERGERIKALRDGRHLTQPAVVDLLERRAGAKVVTLRGYQAWEAGGGIRWENVKLLAEVFDKSAEYVMLGREEKGETPDLSLVRSFAKEEQVDGGFEEFRGHVNKLHERLDEVERALRGRDAHDQMVMDLLNRQSEILENIEATLARLGVTDEATLPDRIAQMVRETAAQEALPAPPKRSESP